MVEDRRRLRTLGIQSGLRWATWGLGAIVVALGGLAIQPEIVGLFHDDGLYLSAAKSLAEGGGYHLPNLPTDPAQTKYPFLYSALLSVLWRVSPSVPAGVPLFKLPGLVAFGAIFFLSAAWYARRVGPDDPWGLMFALLVCLNSGALPFVDYTLTELPFMALCLTALWICERDPVDESTGLRALTARTSVMLGLVVGLAFLLRQAAAPLVLGGAFVLMARRRLDLLIRYVGVVSAIVLPWLVYKVIAAPGDVSPLLEYYVGYEPSVIQLLRTEGPAALQIVWGNLFYAAEALDRALMLPAAPDLRVLVYPITLWGLVRLFRTPVSLLHWFVPGYLGLILLWPWHPSRYMLPLLPIMPLGLVLGTKELWRLVDRLTSGRGRSGARALAALPLSAVVILALGWTAAYLDRDESVRLWFAADTGYSWEGFEETFSWVRENTEPDAILATALDPVYYLHTGRQAIRPWFHRPWTYFYPVGKANPDIGPPTEIHTALETLEARYLIVDPLTGYAERDAAAKLFDRLLDMYASPVFDGGPVLRFVSSDSLHEVYELPRRRVGR